MKRSSYLINRQDLSKNIKDYNIKHEQTIQCID